MVLVPQVFEEDEVDVDGTRAPVQLTAAPHLPLDSLGHVQYPVQLRSDPGAVDHRVYFKYQDLVEEIGLFVESPGGRLPDRASVYYAPQPFFHFCGRAVEGRGAVAQVASGT